jgi:isopenicillin-N N-acyltransferase-like protein
LKRKAGHQAGKERSMDRHIPLVVSTGKPFERGFHLGTVERMRIAYTVQAYMRIFQASAGLEREHVLVLAERYLPVIAEHTPALLEEMRGIASGAGRDLREIVALNARTELLYGGHLSSECTAVALGPQAAADGGIYLAQNWDWHVSLAGGLVLWALTLSEGRRVLTLTEAGIVGKIGTNEDLALCVNLLACDGDSLQPALPMHVILRHVLDTGTCVADARSLIAALPRSTSCNHLLADRSGAIASVEATPVGQQVLEAEDGWLVHTNHCQGARLRACDALVRQSPETLARNQRAQTLLESLPVDQVALRTLFSDHATAPGSICRHVQPESPFVEQQESVASIIFHVGQGVIDLADGPPCTHTYRRMSIDAMYALA